MPKRKGSKSVHRGKSSRKKKQKSSSSSSSRHVDPTASPAFRKPLDRDEESILKYTKLLESDRPGALESELEQDGLSWLLQSSEEEESPSTSPGSDDGPSKSVTPQHRKLPPTRPVLTSDRETQSIGMYLQLMGAKGLDDEQLVNEMAGDGLDVFLHSDASSLDDGSRSETSEENISVDDERVDKGASSKVEEAHDENPLLAQLSRITRASKSGASSSSIEKSSTPSTDQSFKEEVEQAERRCRGYLNRLSESSVGRTAQYVDKLFSEWSIPRKDAHHIFNSLILGYTLNLPENSPLMCVYASVIAAVHAMEGIEIGGEFLERWGEAYSRHYKVSDGRETKNLILMLSCLYQWGLIHCVLLYDLIKSFISAFTVFDLDLLVTLLKGAGAKLRREDSGALKDVVLLLQDTVSQRKSDIEGRGAHSTIPHQGRVDFLLKQIYNLKNNKLTDDYQSIRLQQERIRRAISSLLPRDGISEQLRIGLEELLSSDRPGRWWIQGAPASRTIPANARVRGVAQQFGLDSKLEKLAEKYRMNTDIKRAVFCVIMSSEGYMDAFEKICKLGLRGEQQREIVRVAMQCCMMENNWNSFYGQLLVHTCQDNARHGLTVQYTFWDRFRGMQELKAKPVLNLATLLAYLVNHSAVSLAILKAIPFADVVREPKSHAKILVFLKKLFLELLDVPSSTYVSYWDDLKKPSLQELRDGLAIFFPMLKAMIKREASKGRLSVESTAQVRDNFRRVRRMVQKLYVE